MIRTRARQIFGVLALLSAAGSLTASRSAWACSGNEGSLERTMARLPLLVQNHWWRPAPANSSRPLPPMAVARLRNLDPIHQWVEVGMLYREYGRRDLALPIEAAGRARFNKLTDVAGITSRQIGGIEGSGAFSVGYMLTFPDGQRGYFKPDGPHQGGTLARFRLADAEVSSYHLSEGYAPLGLVPYTRIFTWQGMRGSLQYFVSNLTNLDAARRSASRTQFSDRARARATVLAILTGNFDWRPGNQAFVHPALSPDHVISHDNGLNFTESLSSPAILIDSPALDHIGAHAANIVSVLRALSPNDWEGYLARNNVPEDLIPRVMLLMQNNPKLRDAVAEVSSLLVKEFREDIRHTPMSNWETLLSTYLPKGVVELLIDTVDHDLEVMARYPDLLEILVTLSAPEVSQRFEQMTPLLTRADRQRIRTRVQDILTYMRQQQIIGTPPATTQ